MSFVGFNFYNDTPGDGGWLYFSYLYSEENITENNESYVEYVTRDRAFAASQAWVEFYRNEETIQAFRLRYIPIFISTLVILLNLYFITCIGFVRNLRCAQFVLVLWQAFCDITSVGLSDIYYFTIRETQWYAKIIKRNTWLVKIEEFSFCHLNGFAQLINEYSTSLVLSFFAFERLVLIIFPFRAKTILSKKFYLTSSSLIILLDLFLWIAHFVAIVLDVEGCSIVTSTTSFWISQDFKFWGDLICFYAIPVGFCMACYSVIGFRLFHKSVDNGPSSRRGRARERRKLTLTYSFAISAASWAALWAFYYYSKYLWVYDSADAFQWGYFNLSVYMFNKYIFNLYSAIHPIIFLVINKSFRKPFFSVLSMIRKRLGAFIATFHCSELDTPQAN